MSRFTRFRVLILAMLLAVSHVALLSHVTAHFQPGQQACELCVSESRLLTAIPAADHCLEAAPLYRMVVTETASCSPANVPLHYYHQRAPPIPSV